MRWNGSSLDERRIRSRRDDARAQAAPPESRAVRREASRPRVASIHDAEGERQPSFSMRARWHAGRLAEANGRPGVEERRKRAGPGAGSRRMPVWVSPDGQICAVAFLARWRASGDRAFQEGAADDDTASPTSQVIQVVLAHPVEAVSYPLACIPAGTRPMTGENRGAGHRGPFALLLPPWNGASERVVRRKVTPGGEAGDVVAVQAQGEGSGERPTR